MTNTTELVTNQILIMVASILFGGVIFSKISEIVHIPDVVLFILAGIIMGPYCLNLVSANKFLVGNNLILTIGSAYILYDGGREIDLKVLNKVKLSVILLATLGVIISSYITGFFIMKIFGISFMTALLGGVIIASTDPAVLVPMLKKMKIKDKLKQTIISESAFNDAVGAVSTFAIITIITSSKFSLSSTIFDLIQQIGVGFLVGGILGILSILLISEKAFGVFMEYPAKVVLGTVCAAYTIATMLGGSGFMAVFIAGIIFGNKDLVGITHSKKHAVTHFHFKEVLTTIFKMMIFILLGTQINFSVIFQNWRSALLVVIALIFIARPISVLICTALDRKAGWKLKEILYLMWTRETGVIPAAMAGMVLTMKLENSDIISAITFMTIIITLTLQATSAKHLAKLLRLEE